MEKKNPYWEAIEWAKKFQREEVEVQSMLELPEKLRREVYLALADHIRRNNQGTVLVIRSILDEKREPQVDERMEKVFAGIMPYLQSKRDILKFRYENQDVDTALNPFREALRCLDRKKSTSITHKQDVNPFFFDNMTVYHERNGEVGRRFRPTPSLFPNKGDMFLSDRFWVCLVWGGHISIRAGCQSHVQSCILGPQVHAFFIFLHVFIYRFVVEYEFPLLFHEKPRTGIYMLRRIIL